jgi:hypothetical protein
MTNEPIDDNVRSRTESDAERRAANDDSRGENESLSEIDRHNRNFCIPVASGIFVDPQLSIDPLPPRRLTDLEPELESKFYLKKVKAESQLASRGSPPTLGIDNFCC